MDLRQVFSRRHVSGRLERMVPLQSGGGDEPVRRIQKHNGLPPRRRRATGASLRTCASYPRRTHHPERCRPRRNWALMATITVLAVMKSAPTAGTRKIPRGASTPAARGIATTL